MVAVTGYRPKMLKIDFRVEWFPFSPQLKRRSIFFYCKTQYSETRCIEWHARYKPPCRGCIFFLHLQSMDWLMEQNAIQQIMQQWTLFLRASDIYSKAYVWHEINIESSKVGNRNFSNLPLVTLDLCGQSSAVTPPIISMF